MNTGQSLLTFGAIMLLTVAVLNFYRMSNNIDTALDYNRFRIEALSILTSHIEQSSQYFFDEASVDTTSDKNLGDFTAANSLGFEANDLGVVDDIDDFNGQTIPDTGMSGVVYNVGYLVDYVRISGNSILKDASNRQYHKRVTINVCDTYNPPLLTKMMNGAEVRDTLTMSFVVSYWFYN